MVGAMPATVLVLRNKSAPDSSGLVAELSAIARVASSAERRFATVRHARRRAAGKRASDDGLTGPFGLGR
jgi:hypothetical protein